MDCKGITDVLDVVRHADQALDITVIDSTASCRTSVSCCMPGASHAWLLKDGVARAEVPVAPVRGVS